MKKINILLMSFILFGCDSSSNKYKGTWENIYAKELITTINSKVNPFNTSMSLKYFVSEEIEKYQCLADDSEEDCMKNQLFHSFKILISSIQNPKQNCSENRISGGKEGTG